MQNLEKTYTPKLFEKDIYQKTEKYFAVSEFPENLSNTFSIMMPPPNVTGSLHLGHALTYTIQDILIRFHRQNGKTVLWQPGFDHAGIATQMVVERMLFENKGLKRADISREEFIEETMQWKDQSCSRIREQQKALGCSACWNLSRFTMDDGFIKSVNEVFVNLYKEGLIYKAKRLINWDIKFHTALSDLEIINKEEKGILWHISYKIEDSNTTIVIATTRPETMFGDTAIAVHPEDERYKHLIGKFAIIPYSSKKIPIISDEHCDINKGTGAVKITPAHDFNDFAIGKRHNLDMIPIIDDNGHLMNIDIIPEFLRGVFLKKARKLLLERLKEDEILIKKEEITHSVPYGDRSLEVIEPMLKDQWFIDAPKMAKDALHSVIDKKTRFVPEKWQNTYFDWMRNIEPWCISRQITWGHQIPVWYAPNGTIICEKTEEEAYSVAHNLGIDKNDLIRDTDVLDTWFSSGIWPFATLGWPDQTCNLKNFFPTDVLVTGFDIIFFWVARMMMMSLHFMKQVPFKDVYIHALVRDEKGQKMSKSKGNVIDPMDLINEFGTDALRFTLAFLSVPGRDIKFGKDHVKISRNFITKIWNAARFLQYRGVSFKSNLKDLGSTKTINKWLLSKLKKFQSDIEQNINDYRFDYATRNIQFFIRDIFCDFFVEAVKISDDTEMKDTAGAVFCEFLRIVHPFIPFVTDYLSNTLSGSESLINQPGTVLKTLDLSITDSDIIKIDEFVELIHEIRSAKHAWGVDSMQYQQLTKKINNIDEELKEFISLVSDE